MSDEELNGIEAAAQRLGERGMPGVASDLLRLIAEVRRLKAENENLAGELRDEQAYSKELRENFGEAGMY